MTTATERTREVRAENEGSAEPMGKIERYGRIIGGYLLGFSGVTTTVGALMGGNPASTIIGSAIGLGMIYGADRILKPIHAEWYGEIPVNESTGRKVGRFATFAASLTVTIAGFGMINNAILPNAWTEAGFYFGERVLSGGLGVLALMGGTGLERVSRRASFIDRPMMEATPITTTAAPRARLVDRFRSGARRTEPNHTVRMPETS